MTTEYYIDLITSQHKDKPKFYEMTRQDVEPYVAVENTLLKVPTLYDVDTATGVALDVIGEWVGVSRNILTPLTGVYFAFDDTTDTGWDGGTWRGEFDPDTGLTSLPDDSFRKLIKSKISANKWDGTVEGAYKVWSEVFTNSHIVIEDNQDMTMTIGVAGEKLGAVDKALLTGGYLSFKPCGVRVDYYAIVPQTGTLFGWDVCNSAFGGFDSGQWAQEIQ